MHNFYSCLSPFLLAFPYFPRKSFILLALFYSLIKRSVFFTFLLLFQNTWKKCQERGFVRADSLKVLSSMAGKIKLQDCCMLVTLHLQPGNREIHEFWCWCPTYFICPTFCECRPTFRVWFLSSEMPLWEHPCSYAEKCLLDDWF